MLCWVYPENTDGPIFNYKITGWPWAVHFWMHSGKLYGVLSQRNYVVIYPWLLTYPVVALSQWHYVGFTYSRITGMGKLWLDGQRVLQRNIGAGLSLSTQDNVRMGAIENDGRYFKGRITAMQIYDVALTEDQINAVENAGQGNHNDTLTCKANLTFFSRGLSESHSAIIKTELFLEERIVGQGYLKTSAVGCLIIA